jgi:predicted nucleic acid-binding protein
MTQLVADTSGLVSLGIPAEGADALLDLCLTGYDVSVPETVLEELREVASYDDVHGNAATTVTNRVDRLTVQSVTLDAEFPLDDGENAAITLANDGDAALLLSDEFTRLGLVHASLANTRLVTTPTLLSVFVRKGQFDADRALGLLDSIKEARSWDANSYVQRARTLLTD